MALEPRRRLVGQVVDFAGVGVLRYGTLAIVLGFAAALLRKSAPIDRTGRRDWRMPPLATLRPARLSGGRRFWLLALRLYLVVATGLVLARIVQLAISHPTIGAM